jgi:hypothetical protein
MVMGIALNVILFLASSANNKILINFNVIVAAFYVGNQIINNVIVNFNIAQIVLLVFRCHTQ